MSQVVSKDSLTLMLQRMQDSISRLQNAPSLMRDFIASRAYVLWQVSRHDARDVSVGGWNPAWSGGFEALSASWGYLSIQSMFPELEGFTREYRFFYQLWYGGVGGTTSAQVQFGWSANPMASDPVYISSPTSARDITGYTEWMSSAATDEVADPTHVYATFLGQYTGTSPATATGIRNVGLEGRYVKV